MEHAFGAGAPFALGMEEELFLVEAGSLGLAHVAGEVIARAGAPPERLIHDTYEATLELTTPVVADAEAGARALGGLREAVRAAGATPLGAGLHPEGAFGDVVHVPAERYAAIAADVRGLLSRTPTCAVHVHVGMPDAETAVRALNAMRHFLPVLQGLAAHSPYWHGRDSGFQSARAQLFRGYPRAIIPPAFTGWEAYAAFMDAWLAAAELADSSFLWWDVRPSPRLGTLEVRAMDGQARLGSVAGLAALAHGLILACASGAEPKGPPHAEAIAESSFRASRDGLTATLWWDGALRPFAAVAREALALARPRLREAGGEDALEEVERILAEGNGADRMRATHVRGGMRAVLERLVAETAA